MATDFDRVLYDYPRYSFVCCVIRPTQLNSSLCISFVVVISVLTDGHILLFFFVFCVICNPKWFQNAVVYQVIDQFHR